MLDQFSLLYKPVEYSNCIEFRGWLLGPRDALARNFVDLGGRGECEWSCRRLNPTGIALLPVLLHLLRHDINMVNGRRCMTERALIRKFWLILLLYAL